MDTNLVIVADPDEVKKETRCEFLNGKGFVRGDSDQHQWYLFVNQACAASRIFIDDVMKEYLGNMLWRFSCRAELFEQLAAFDFCQHIFETAQIDSPCAQDVADISLQYVAFFPEKSMYRHQPRSLEYIANLGTGLYQELARSSVGKDDCFSRAYEPMATHFGKAVMILRSARSSFNLNREYREYISRRSLYDAVRFPSDVEAAKLAGTLRNLRFMYFQFDGQQGLKNN